MRDSSPPEAMRASGPRRLPRVGREQEDDLIDAVAAEVDLLGLPAVAADHQRAAGAAAPLERHAEPGAGEPEILELPLDPLGQRPPPRRAGGGERQRRLAVVGEGGGDLGLQLVAVVGVPFELGELGGDLGPPGEHGARVRRRCLRARRSIVASRSSMKSSRAGSGSRPSSRLPERARRLRQADARLLDLRPPGRRLRLPGLDLGEQRSGLADPLDGRALLVEQQGEGGAERAGDRLGVAQHVALGLAAPPPRRRAAWRRRSRRPGSAAGRAARGASGRPPKGAPAARPGARGARTPRPPGASSGAASAPPLRSSMARWRSGSISPSSSRWPWMRSR